MVRPGPTTRDPERDQHVLCGLLVDAGVTLHTTLEFCVPRWRYILSYTAYLDVIMRTRYQPLQKRNVVESSMVGGAGTGNDIYAGSKKGAHWTPTGYLCRNRRTLTGIGSKMAAHILNPDSAGTGERIQDGGIGNADVLCRIRRTQTLTRNADDPRQRNSNRISMPEPTITNPNRKRRRWRNPIRIPTVIEPAMAEL